MNTRRDFIAKASLAGLGLASTGVKGMSNSTTSIPQEQTSRSSFKLPANFGMGGVGSGNGWHVNTNKQIDDTHQAAWDAGVRYFDTSPFYGYGLSERRLGHFLYGKPRNEFIISTKVGRVFKADRSAKADAGLWKGVPPFKFDLDYSADAVRRSIEDSLQRLGLSSIDIVFVHDLSPEMGEKWIEHFNIAAKGAFPVLSKMRDEGIIKSWGMGVNTPEPILKSLEVADPDMMLVAIQYSLVEHKNALNNVFPAMQKKGVKAVIGGPINAGFLANRERFNYGPTIPPEMLEKRNKLNAAIKKFDVDLRTVALQFAAAHPAVSAVIPGASRPEQATENVASMSKKIPAELWEELKRQKLIEANAPVPGEKLG